MTANAQFREGEIFGDVFRIEGLVGSGGMGHVYRVRDIRRTHTVRALKVFDSIDEKKVEMFRQEFSFLAASQHPNIVQVFDYGVDRKTSKPFYTAELLEGPSLRELKTTWSQAELVEVLFQIGRTLKFLHSRGIVHGDIKPTNIIRVAQDPPFKLLDFGLALSLMAKRPDGTISGTPAFMSPEVKTGSPPDERSDLYSLGATIFFLATRRRLKARLKAYRPDLSEEFEQIVIQLLAENPDGRFQRADQLMKTLNRRISPPTPIETPKTLAAYAAAPLLIGRDPILSEILSLFKDPVGIESRKEFITVAGPVGIGKSRLLQEISRKLQLHGLETTFVTCKSATTTAVEILENCARSLAMEEGESNPKFSGDPEIVSDRLEILTRLLSERVAERRHVLIVDDVDALAEDERTVFFRAFRRVIHSGKTKWAVILSSEMATSLAAAEFSLPALTPSEVRTYFALFAEDIHPAVHEKLFEKCGGIPLLMENVAQSFFRQADLWRKIEFADEISKFKPTTDIATLFAERIEGLPPEERKVMTILALSARPIPQQALDEKLRAGLPGLIELRLIRSDATSDQPIVRIANHALAEVVLKALKPQEKRAIHAEIAAFLIDWQKTRSDRSAPADEMIAFHLLEGDQIPEAIPYLRNALSRLRRLHSHREAIALLEAGNSVLTRLPPGEARDEIVAWAVDIYARVGRFGEALSLLSRFPGDGPDQTLVRLRKTADLQLKRRNLVATMSMVSEAEAWLSKGGAAIRRNEEIRLLSLRQIASLFLGKLDDVESVGERIERSIDPDLVRERILSLCMRGHAAMRRNQAEAARKLYETARTESNAKGYIPGVSMAWGSLAICFQERASVEEALKAYDQAVEAAEASLDFLSCAAHQLNLGTFLQSLGRYAEAMTAYDRSLELYERIGSLRDHSLAIYRKAKLLYFLTKDPLLENLFEAALKVANQADHLEVAGYCHAALSRLASGDDRAKRHWTDAKALFEKRNDSAGNFELDVIAAERGWKDPLSEGIPKAADLSQRLRLLALNPGAGSVDLENLCRRDRNPEWLARFLSLRATASIEGRKNVNDALHDARDAVRLYERQSVKLDEGLRSSYLAVRQVPLLRDFTRKISVNVSDEVTKIESAPDLANSIRVARRLSNEAVTRLLDIIADLNSESDFEKLTDRIVDYAIELSRSERGALIQLKDGVSHVVSARNMKKQWIQDLSEKMSQQIVEGVLMSGKSLLENRTPDSPLWESHESLVISNIQSFMCVPCRTQSGMLSVIYLDRQQDTAPYSHIEALVAEAMAQQAALFMEKIARIDEARQQGEKIRYLNQQLETALKTREGELTKAQELLLIARRDQILSGRYGKIVGTSPAIRKILEVVDHAAQSRASVHIFGESGTGKELVARALHEQSPWKEGPFVPVNCGAIPGDLFESMFFGYVKGAFTGAEKEQSGFFLLANGGTLFLDEIDALKPDMQVKLLRVLQESKIRPIGKLEETEISVRMITAVNKDLDGLVAAGSFREDLYYRLHVVRIDIPPLRDHPEDIPALVHHFLSLASEASSTPPPLIGDDVLSVMMGYGWPGNVRQLKNEIERIIAMLPEAASGRAIATSMLSPQILREARPQKSAGLLADSIDAISRDAILTALERHLGNKTLVAKELGLSRLGLRKKMKRLGVNGPQKGSKVP